MHIKDLLKVFRKIQSFHKCSLNAVTKCTYFRQLFKNKQNKKPELSWMWSICN